MIPLKHAPAASQGPLVVGFGESLFDCFPTRQVLGGAPLNLAVHAAALLRGVGGSAVVVTRVGSDPLGDRIVSELSSRGLSSDFVQRDGQLPTGRVDVTFDPSGQAEYRFDTPSAWDEIAFEPTLQALAELCDAVTFGTLGQRSAVSRATLGAFLTATRSALRLFDVNLRQQYYDAGLLDASLRLATAVKLNDAELLEVGELLGYGPRGAHHPDLLAQRIATAYKLDWLAVTRGKDGVTLFAGGEKHVGAPVPTTPVEGADTVGAGDACGAALVCGFLLGMPIDKTLRWANAVGSFVASHPGATPRLPTRLTELAEDEKAFS